MKTKMFISLFVVLTVSFVCQSCETESQPFEGFWENYTENESMSLYMDLYDQSIPLPGSDQPMMTYGYLVHSNEYYFDYWVISKVLAIKGNEAHAKVFSLRYGTPDDEEDVMIKYDPKKRELEFKRSESPVLFQETPPIPSDALKLIYTYANIKQSEMIFLSFYKRGDLWLLEESYSTVYEDGTSRYLNTKVSLASLEDNRFLITHERRGFMLEIDKLNKENMIEIEPRSVYYAASIKSFLKDGKIYEHSGVD